MFLIIKGLSSFLPKIIKNIYQFKSNEFETKCQVIIDALDKNHENDTQNQLLSIVPDCFSKKSIKNSFNFSFRQIDNARKNSKAFGIGQKFIKKKKILFRFDLQTIESFLSFITSESYLHDVASSSNTMKLENNLFITI